MAGLAGYSVLAVGQQQQQAPQPDATLQALLGEVRLLRIALQQSAVVTPKIQMTLLRMQMQQEVVARTSKELELVRMQLTKAGTEESAMSGEVKRLQDEVNRAQEPGRRAELEGRFRAFQAMVEQQSLTSGEMRAKEADLSGRLRNEQMRLEELNEKLTALERQLEAVGSGSGQPPTAAARQP